jgi:hypothetical protein
MSVTKQIKYHILKKYEGKLIRPDPKKLEFGNSQLIVYHDKTLSVLFDIPYTYFDTRGKDYKEFLGSVEETVGYEKLEFHEVFFEGDKPYKSFD